jgi:hypothetical protein
MKGKPEEKGNKPKVKDDGGKKMLSDKEAKPAISEYMIKVIQTFYITFLIVK